MLQYNYICSNIYSRQGKTPIYYKVFQNIHIFILLNGGKKNVKIKNFRNYQGNGRR